jgi:hypothetical protein
MDEVDDVKFQISCYPTNRDNGKQPMEDWEGYEKEYPMTFNGDEINQQKCAAGPSAGKLLPPGM